MSLVKKKNVGIQLDEDFLDEFSHWARVHDLSKSEAIKTAVWAFMRMDESTRSKCTEASNHHTDRVSSDDVIVLVDKDAFAQLKFIELTTMKNMKRKETS